jgi:hypothetical protein
MIETAQNPYREEHKALKKKYNKVIIQKRRIKNHEISKNNKPYDN